MNYAEIQEAIRDYLEEIDEPRFERQLPNFVRAAERRIFRLNPFRNTIATDDAQVVLSQGQDEISHNLNYLELLTVAITGSGEGLDEVKPLMRVDPSYIREAYRDRTQLGEPYHYAVKDERTILVGPTAIRNYPLLIDYTRFPESIVTAGTTWLGTNWPHLIVYGALVEAYTFLKGEPDLLQHYQMMFQQEAMMASQESDDAPRDASAGTR